MDHIYILLIHKAINPKNKDIACFRDTVLYSTNQIREAYISKYNHERNIQVILLMITNDDENWHYLALKSLFGLLRGITSNKNGGFYCLNCFHSYKIKEALKNMKKYAKGKI